jgi:hypothetical protein
MRELFSRRVVAADNVLVRELSGEAVILNLGNETYYGLDEVGYRIWAILTAKGSVADAFDHLLSEYDVEPTRLRQDMEELICQCVEQGLLQLVTA